MASSSPRRAAGAALGGLVGDTPGLAAGSHQALGRGIGILLAAPRHDDFCTGLGELLGDGGADAPRTSRDQGDPPVEAEGFVDLHEGFPA